MSENLPVPAQPAVTRRELDGALTQWSDPFAERERIFSTFPAEWTNKTSLEAQAISEDTTAGATMMGKELQICHLVWHYVEVKGKEDGELVPAWRIVLIGPNGERWDFVALSIFKAIKLLAHVHGEPPWEPPVLCTLGMKKTRTGGNWYVLTDRGRLGAVDAQQKSPKKGK